MQRAPTIYFARAGSEGPIKIGFTTSAPAERIASLQTGCPWPISLLAELRGSLREEARLHRMFKDSRLVGEWFAADEALLSLVQQVKAGRFEWPSEPEPAAEPIVTLQSSVSGQSVKEIIRACGGVNRIAAAAQWGLTIDAVHKWRRSGIPDWHWPLLMSLCGITAAQLLDANEDARRRARLLKVA